MHRIAPHGGGRLKMMTACPFWLYGGIQSGSKDEEDRCRARSRDEDEEEN